MALALCAEPTMPAVTAIAEMMADVMNERIIKQ